MKTKIETIMSLADSYATYAATAGIERYLGQNRTFDLAKDARNALRTALDDMLNPGNPISAFRQGLLYASKKYDIEFVGTFTANDVRIFLEMEDAELEDYEILDLLTKQDL